MTVSTTKIADWSYALFTEQKEQFRDRLREALLTLMREGEGEKLLKALSEYTERIVPRDAKEKQLWIRNMAGRQYWDLCYDLAQRVPLVQEEITVPSKVVTLQNRQSIAGERHLVAVPIAFPVRAVLDEHMDLQLDALNTVLIKEHGVSGHWFPGLVDDYPIAELHVVEWLKVHDELFYDRMPEERREELRFNAQRRSDRFHYRGSDQNWDWDFLIVLGSVEGQWTAEAVQAVQKHLQEVIAPTRKWDVSPENMVSVADSFRDGDPFEVGRLDFLRQAQYQGGWIAKQRAVDDFLNRTKGPFRLVRMLSGLMRGWVLSNGTKDWVYVTPDMNGKNWEECLMMIWEAFERNHLGMVQIGDEPQNPGTVPAFVRH